MIGYESSDGMNITALYYNTLLQGVTTRMAPLVSLPRTVCTGVCVCVCVSLYASGSQGVYVCVCASVVCVCVPVRHWQSTAECQCAEVCDRNTKYH